MNNLEKRLTLLQEGIDDTWAKLNLDEKFARLAHLQEESAKPELWNDLARAKSVNTELKKLENELSTWQILKSQANDLHELIELKKSLRFTDPLDQKDAIIRITAGAGGTEAMDWAGILERMYLRFFEKHGYEVELIERSTGEEAGIKTAVYEVYGPEMYGHLKSEHGVHRLVRLSPFNADNLRQTSFSLVEVLPILDSEDDLKIDEKDLRIDTYHAGGHGGQSVNTTNSAIRITHLPTNTVVAIQNERSQLQNREKAMEILRGKLLKMQQDQQAESINQLRAGESASWGQQIRNYVMQPYKLVKDTRTKYEETDVDSVLDGKIDNFIDAYLESLVGSNN